MTSLVGRTGNAEHFQRLRAAPDADDLGCPQRLCRAGLLRGEERYDQSRCSSLRVVLESARGVHHFADGGEGRRVHVADLADGSTPGMQAHAEIQPVAELTLEADAPFVEPPADQLRRAQGLATG